MAKRLDLQFSHRFKGTIWNTIADGNNARLFLEVRDPERKTVSFSALNLRNKQWLWKDVVFEEPWWVSMLTVESDVLLLTLYTDSNNPDRKSLIAWDVMSQRLIWWKNGFSVTRVGGGAVAGVDAQFPEKESVLDLFTGQPAVQVDFHLEDSQNFPVIRPFQYREGAAHFETVRNFLNSRCGILPVATIEYLEFEELIVISAFQKENEDLANYLYVFDTNGDLLASEKLGEDLKGVGLDTFYIFLRHLIFVKNKNELIILNII